jgi:hypothetical protein
MEHPLIIDSQEDEEVKGAYSIEGSEDYSSAAAQLIDTKGLKKKKLENSQKFNRVVRGSISNMEEQL